MDSPGVLRDILFILVPLRAGREDEHFLYHSDTHLLSVSANKAPRAAFCAVEMDNGFSLPFPMKKHTKEISHNVTVGLQGYTVKLHNIQYIVYVHVKM